MNNRQEENHIKYSLAIVFILTLVIGVACNGDISPQSIVLERNDGAYKLTIDLSGSLQNPAFSPDSKSIVFTRFRDGYNQGPSDLFIYNLETGQLTTLISDGESNVNLPGSAWNETINSVVFSSARDPHDEIFLISDTGSTGEEIQITNREDKQAYEPSFSPDGQWIVFESHAIDVEDGGVITKYKVGEGSEYIGLTVSTDDCRQPNWSPLGGKILYQKEENGKWAIWTMDVNGEDKTMITGPNLSATDAVFSYDGEWIIYSAENDHVALASIYRIPSDGGEAIQITRYQGYDGAPSISSDGTIIAFESSDGDPEKSGGTAIWMIDITP